MKETIHPKLIEARRLAFDIAAELDTYFGSKKRRRTVLVEEDKNKMSNERAVYNIFKTDDNYDRIEDLAVFEAKINKEKNSCIASIIEKHSALLPVVRRLSKEQQYNIEDIFLVGKHVPEKIWYLK